MQVRTIGNGLIFVVLAALLPMAVLSVLQGRAARKDSRELAINQLRVNAWNIAESERDAFLIAQYGLRVVAQNKNVVEYRPLCGQVLANTLEASVGLINFTRVDASGRVRCSAVPVQGKPDVSDQPWWQKASKSVGLALSNPVNDNLTRRPMLLMSRQLRDARGAGIGIVTAAVSLQALQESLARRRAADPDAVIKIVGSDGATILKNDNIGLEGIRILPRAAGALSARSRDGTEWLYATAPLFGKDLVVLYTKPSQRLLASGASQMRLSIMLPIVAIALASLAIWFGTHWLVVQWLQRLRALARQFARADFSGQRAIYRTAPVEVRDLADDLHAMGDALESRNKELTLALEAKTALTREVNHRVKNNLQIVTSLLTLQANRVADPSARNVLGQAKARISALGLIHRVMYQQDNENELGNVNVRVLIMELCPQLRAANSDRPGINLDCDCDDIKMSVDQAVPLTLFIVEAVTNAFRHAYSITPAGTVAVNMILLGETAELSISDDGSGYAVEESVANMGVELMNAFAGQLNSTMKVSSTSAGTVITLVCPLVSY